MFSKDFFDKGLNRIGTRCEKWDGMRKREGEGLLAMWVADMDFQSPPAIQEALIARAEHPTYGYTEVLEDDFSAPINFWQRRHQIDFKQEELMILPCVVTGLKICIQAFSHPGDPVVIQSPVYGPFAHAVTSNGRSLADAPLVCDEKGHYTMDLAATEEHFKKGARLMLLCSPHNPVSRVWSKQELKALMDLCKKYQVILVSDEIHSEFALDPFHFTSVFHLSPNHDDLLISLGAASKTFNVAGLQQATLFCKNPQLRLSLERLIQRIGITSGNIFALEGTRAAYNHGDAWLDGLKTYLKQGADLLNQLLKANCPKAILSPLEGTYLAWINIRAYGTSNELLPKIKKAGLYVNDGRVFGEKAGEGHIRLNIGCPHSHIEKAVAMLKEALEGEL